MYFFIKPISLLILVYLCAFSGANAQIKIVPQNYTSIQSAIDAAVDGDTILVLRGRYFENINFRGKGITLTSNFIFTQNVEDIDSTIIDGSQPVNPDTASCVLFISGEDSTAILQGFTITNGKGTVWPDEHSSGTYREGGGIITAFSSPIIRYNFIISNEAINKTSLSSAGGGGIRSGDGYPKIFNNVIMNNKGRYGAGIVLNYCSATLSNNIIVENVGGEDYGGGGIWINDLKEFPNVLVNNTILSNKSVSDGGGILVYSSSSAQIINNIIFNNIDNTNSQISLRSGANAEVIYCDIEGGYPGVGNFNLSPSFLDSSFYLNNNSPCIDAGDPDIQFNDIENLNLPGNALWPSMGNLRNDVGAYGGPSSSILVDFSIPSLYIPSSEYDFGLTYPNEPVEIFIPIINNGSALLNIDSVTTMNDEISIQNSFPLSINPILKDSLILIWLPQTEKILADTLYIFHNCYQINNPYKVLLIGSSIPSALLVFNTTQIDFGDIDASIESVDTTVYVYNAGTAPDSVNTSIIYALVTPDSSLNINPKVFEIQAKDSAGVVFTIYPSKVNPRFPNIFSPKIVIDSKFSIWTKHFERVVRFHLIGINSVEDNGQKIIDYDLSQNYPNPFNPTTKIDYQLPIESKVILKVYDILGREVATLVNENQEAGYKEINFDASLLSSGIYLYKLIAGDFVSSKKMIVIK
jgi:hypothetical protein